MERDLGMVGNQYQLVCASRGEKRLVRRQLADKLMQQRPGSVDSVCNISGMSPSTLRDTKVSD
jgi:hypothetical protein